MYWVMELLNWTEMEYTTYVFKMGVKYLEVVMPQEEYRSVLMASNEYWGWWKLLWFAREQQFINDCEAARNLTKMYVGPSGKLKQVSEMQPADLDYAPHPLRTLKGRNDVYLALNDYKNLANDEQTEASYCRDFQTLMKTKQ